MKIAFLGLGDYGSRIAARLIDGGVEMTLIARGERFKALQSEGLKSTHGFGGEALHIQNVIASDNPSKVGIVDLLIISVKLYQLRQAASDAAPLVGPETIVLPLLNGVEAPDILNEVLENGHVLGASTSPNLPIGEWPRGTSDATAKVVKVFTDAGITASEDKNVIDEVWTKFSVYVGVAGTCAISRLPVSGVAEHPELRKLSIALTNESGAIAERAGISDPYAVAKNIDGGWDRFPNPELRPSLLQDLEAGKPLELDAGPATLSRLGREYGIPTPVNDTIYAALKPYEAGS